MTEKTDNLPKAPPAAAQPRRGRTQRRKRTTAAPTFALPKTYFAQRRQPSCGRSPPQRQMAHPRQCIRPMKRTSSPCGQGDRQYIEDQSGKPARRGRGRPRKQAHSGQKAAWQRTMRPLPGQPPRRQHPVGKRTPKRQSSTKRAVIATIELQPIMDQLLNQPIPSIRAPGQTIDQKTVLTQDKVAIGLMRRFAAENSVALGIDEFPYVNFADWLLGYSFRVAPTTFTKYRYNVVDYLTGLPGEDVTKAINIIIHWDSADDEEEGGRPREEGKLS